MRSAPPIFPGDRLTLDDYLADYESRAWNTDRTGDWKLERRQSFRELDNPSWEAAAQGDWEKATHLLQQDKDNVRKYQQKILDHGFEMNRVRVVEKPYSPYLIWELNSLLIRHEFGERIRVLSTENLHTVEKGHPLPEILVLGTEVVYRVIYDETGLPSAAIRCTLAGTVRSWAGFIRHLHDQGEDLPDFFAREIAGLRPAYQP
jgi:hypothetical protein